MSCTNINYSYYTKIVTYYTNVAVAYITENSYSV